MGKTKDTRSVIEPEHFRLRSVRGARRGIEEAIASHREGLITPTSLSALVSAYKAWTEIFLVEQQLARLGLDVEQAGHAMGEDGGFTLQKVRGPVLRRAVTREGETPRGMVAERVETLEGLVPAVRLPG